MPNKSTNKPLLDEKTEQSINDLLCQMTLSEKIGQMTQYGKINDREVELIKHGKVGSLLNVRGAKRCNEIQRIAVQESRLGIPLIFGDDVIHGYKTIFPIPLAESCSWDLDLYSKSAEISAKEAAASGIRWVFSPMVDVSRDARWGRVMEGPGEDTYLASKIAGAKINGYQKSAEDGNPYVAACPKHFAGYGAVLGGLDYNEVNINERELREVYLPPFKAAIEEGAVTLMSAFVTLNGIPATGNQFLFKQILRDEWGFSGFTVSDWGSVIEMIKKGYTKTHAEAAEKACNAQIDMEMDSGIYEECLAKLVDDGIIKEEVINTCVSRILRVKYWLGLFDNPYVPEDQESLIQLCLQHLEIARDIARKSIVLLKNDNKLLPLDRNIQKLAVIGSIGDNKYELKSNWSDQGNVEDVVTILKGIENKVSQHTQIFYAKGCEIEGDSLEGIQEAVEIARKCDVAIVIIGETYAMNGEACSRSRLDIPGQQMELLKAIYELKIPIVVILSNGRPIELGWINEKIPAIVEAWQLGTQAGNAIADVVFGDYNPSGKLTMTFPQCLGQVPIYYNQRKLSRPKLQRYYDSTATPLYPFGFGLSYTTFEYKNIELSANTVKMPEILRLSAEVENVGELEGYEVVQLYICDEFASVARPVKELKGFQKIFLKPGEKKIVEFELCEDDLAFYNNCNEFVVEPGEFTVWIGKNSNEGIKASFEVVL